MKVRVDVFIICLKFEGIMIGPFKMFSYLIPMRYSLGNHTLDCDECISKLDDNGLCSCIGNDCNVFDSGIIPYECIRHFITNVTVNSECFQKIISNFSHCEPANSGNFQIFCQVVKNRNKF